MAKKQTSKKASSRKRTAASGSSGDVSAALAELNSLWAETPAAADNGGTIPEGRYQALIDEMKVEHSQAGRLQVTTKLKIAGGEYKNRVVYKRDGIDNAESMGYTKAGLARLGVEVESATDLSEALVELTGTYCEINVRHKGEKDNGEPWVNVYFNGALDDDAVDTEGLEEVDEGEEVEAEVEAEEAEAEGDWNVGDKVQVDFDGDWYTGDITEVGDGEATVNFEDGTTDTVAFDDLQAFDPDGEDDGDDEEEAEEEGEEPEAEAEEEEGEEGEGGVSLGFDDSKITSAHETKLSKIAGDWGFDPDDYEAWTDLVIDLLDYAEASGEFKTPAAALKALAAKS